MTEKAIQIVEATSGRKIATRDAFAVDNLSRAREIQLTTPIPRQLDMVEIIRGVDARITSDDSTILDTWLGAVANYEKSIDIRDKSQLIVIPDFSINTVTADITAMAMMRYVVNGGSTTSQTNLCPSTSAIGIKKSYTGVDDPSPTYAWHDTYWLVMGDYLNAGTYEKWLGGMLFATFDCDFGAFLDTLTFTLKELSLESGSGAPLGMKIAVVTEDEGYDNPFQSAIDEDVVFTRCMAILEGEEGLDLDWSGHTVSAGGDAPFPDLTSLFERIVNLDSYEDGVTDVWVIIGNTTDEADSAVAIYDIETTDAQIDLEYTDYLRKVAMQLGMESVDASVNGFISSNELGNSYTSDSVIVFDVIGATEVYLHLQNITNGGIRLYAGAI